MKDQTNIFLPKPSNPAEMFANENDIDGPQDTELKRAIINFIKEFQI